MHIGRKVCVHQTQQSLRLQSHPLCLPASDVLTNNKHRVLGVKNRTKNKSFQQNISLHYYKSSKQIRQVIAMQKLHTDFPSTNQEPLFFSLSIKW